MIQKRVMVFVDGTNLLVQMGKVLGVKVRADKPTWASIEFARQLVTKLFRHRGADVAQPPIRRYWFASYTGSDECHDEYADVLRRAGFEPVLFRKRKGREKGVDIALTMGMLVNAFNQNFDLGVLVAGDEDYVGHVQETKRYGPVIEGAFFDEAHGLAKALRIACDGFYVFASEHDLKFDSHAEAIGAEISKGKA